MNGATEAAGVRWDHTTPEPEYDPTGDDQEALCAEAARIADGASSATPSVYHIHALIAEIKMYRALLRIHEQITFGSEPF